MEDDEQSGRATVPGFQAGARVRETGLALVHEGEFIVPAEGSEAAIEPADVGEQAVVNYYFPVEVVFVGGLPEEERARIEAGIWERLSGALDRMT